MMSYLIIPLLVYVMVTPVKPSKPSDYSSSTIEVTNKSEEESKQVINNKNEITLTSIIDNIYKLSNNNRRPLKENYQTYRSFTIKKNKNQRPLCDSKIYYVRLPPAPYFFVPGLGYVSNQPQFSTTSLRPYKHKQNHNKVNSLINLPIDFISNGRPSSVYQWEKPLKDKRESPVIKLKKGPYEFNGKPSSLYLFGSAGQISKQSISQSNN